MYIITPTVGLRLARFLAAREPNANNRLEMTAYYYFNNVFRWKH